MNSLNLLPEEIKKEIALSKKNAKLREILFRVIALSFCLLVFVATLGFYVKSVQNFVEEEKEMIDAQLATAKNGETEAKDFYDRLELVRKTNSEKINWNAVLGVLSSQVPANLMIDSMNFPNDTSKRATLTGKALSDSDISSFRDLLANSKVFNYVDIEKISDGTDPKSENRKVRDFTMSLSINYKEAAK